MAQRQSPRAGALQALRAVTADSIRTEKAALLQDNTPCAIALPNIRGGSRIPAAELSAAHVDPFLVVLAQPLVRNTRLQAGRANNQGRRSTLAGDRIVKSGCRNTTPHL